MVRQLKSHHGKQMVSGCLSLAFAQSNPVEDGGGDPTTAAVSETPFPGLRELVLLVLQFHPELSQAEAESRMALSRVSEARAGGYPQLSFSSSYGQEKQKLYESNRSNTFNNQAQAQLKLTQPLFDLSLGANLRRFKAGSQGMDWQLVLTREQLVLKTIELYVEIVKIGRAHV